MPNKYSLNNSLDLAKINLVLFLFLFIILSAITVKNFWTVGNFLNILSQSSTIGIVSIGMTFVILVCGIDLSVGSLSALVGMVAGYLMSNGCDVFIAVLSALLVGSLLGAFSGSLIAFGNVPAFIVTLAVMEISRALARLITAGRPISNFPESFYLIGGSSLGGLPIKGVIWIVLTVLSWLVLRYTVFGRSLYAIGGNYEAARLSGMPVKRNIILAFVLSGFMAALSGVILASWLTVSQPNAGISMELDAIASVVLGGAALSGGRGGVWGTFLGVWILALITNVFNLIGLASEYQMIFKGLIIIIALLLNKFYTSKQ